MPDLDWTECPACGKTVFVAGGRLGAHQVPREARRWPKMGEICQRGGTHLEPEPLLEM